jgi:site-specific DNA recombinase
VRGCTLNTTAKPDRLTRLARAVKARITCKANRIAKLYEAEETGEIDNADTLRNRFSELEQRREEVMRCIAMLTRRTQQPQNLLTPDKPDKAAAALRDKLRNGPKPFRQAYMRLVVERNDVDDEEIRISERKDLLHKALIQQDQPALGIVPSFVQNWRPQGDSNPRRRRERAVS